MSNKGFRAHVFRNFGKYQVEAPALAADAIYAMKRCHTRWECFELFIYVAILVGMPITVVSFGFEELGNKYAFGVVLVIWQVLTAVYGSPYRVRTLSGETTSHTQRLFPLYATRSVAAIAIIVCPVLVRVVLAGQHTWWARFSRGALLGIAVSSALEVARDIVVIRIASRNGRPIYTKY
jgi:hypothetical protein